MTKLLISLLLSASLAFGGTVTYPLKTTLGGTGVSVPAAVNLASSGTLQNGGLSASISSNTLVVSLKQSDGSTDPASSSPVTVGYRSSTATSGAYSTSSLTSGYSVTAGADDGLGYVISVSPQRIHVYLIDDTTDELCLSKSYFNDGDLASATAFTGGAENTYGTLYCTSSHTSKPIRYVGYVVATWSFGTPKWTSVTSVALGPPKTESGSFTMSCSGPFTPQTATAYYSKTGSTVNITTQGIVAACNASSLIGCSTQVPNQLRPATDFMQTVSVTDNSSVQDSPGYANFQQDGDMLVSKTLTGTNFTASGNCGFSPFSVSYQTFY